MKTNVNNVNLAVIPQDFLTKVEADLFELKIILKAKNQEEVNSQWIESSKIPRILGISRKTWQTYRDKRLLAFSQIGSKTYVRRADLEDFMMSHRIEAQ